MRLYLHKATKTTYISKLCRFVLSTESSLYLYECVKEYDTSGWSQISQDKINTIVIDYTDSEYPAYAFADKEWFIQAWHNNKKYVIFNWEFGEPVEDQYIKCMLCYNEMKTPEKNNVCNLCKNILCDECADTRCDGCDWYVCFNCRSYCEKN